MTETNPLANPRSTESAAFFRSWLRDPWHVAAVAPSGKSLARLMASGLSSGARVVEFGAGTGTLTQAILDAGVHPEDLTLIEQHAGFVGILQRRFPDTRILEVDAAEIGAWLPWLAGKVDFVISGLPIVWFNKAKKAAILSGSASALHAHGCYHQFTYLGRLPIGRKLLQSTGFKASLLGVAALNAPPAFVYRFRKTQD